MKLKLFSVLALGGLLSAAFACGDSSGDGGSGGSGGSGGDTTSTTGTKGTGSTTKATTGGMTTATTTSSGQMGCDAIGVCNDMDMDDTNDCQSCAFAGPCNDQVVACAGNAECVNDTPEVDSFLECIDLCEATDQVCFDACVDSYPTGATLYNDLALCVICDTCPTSCDNTGCP